MLDAAHSKAIFQEILVQIVKEYLHYEQKKFILKAIRSQRQRNAWNKDGKNEHGGAPGVP